MIDTIIGSIISGAISVGIPLLFVALGETYAEKSGILNISTEAMMLLGAFAGFMTAYITGSTFAGLVVSVLAGMFMGLLMSILSVNLRANQVVAGYTLTLLTISLTSFAYRAYFGIATFYPTIQGLENLPIPLLSQIPIIGEAIFSQNILIYLGIVLLPVFHFVLYRTHFGLNIRAVGENPSAADTAGVNVSHVKYFCLLIGGAMAALGGAAITIGSTHFFSDEITAFRGWMAIALVIFGGWDPKKVFASCLVFGAAETSTYILQAMGYVGGGGEELIIILPYALVIVVLFITALRRRTAGPAALGVPYKRGER